MKSDNALAIALAPPGAVRDWPVCWWRIVGGQVVESGEDSRAPDFSQSAYCIGLAPTSAIGLHRLNLSELATRQAAAVAKRSIAEEGLISADALHVAATTDGNFVSVTQATMQTWATWAMDHGLRFDSIVPAALLIDGDDGGALRATIGHESFILHANQAFVAEASLIDALVGGAPITDVPQGTIERAIAAACDHPPAELMSGQWARRSGPMFDMRRLARTVKIGAAILLLSLAIPLVQWWKLVRDTSRLDEQSVTAAGRILTPAPPAGRIVGALDAKLAALGGGGALLSTPLTALTQAMETAPTVSVDALAWHGDNVLIVTLAAPRNEDIQPILNILQSAGYRVAYQIRGGSDGRSHVDVTIRSAS